MKTLSLISALLLTLLPLHTWATKETFSGTMCESLYDNTWPYGEDVAYQYGAIWNRSSTHWAYVDCPVPRANGYSSGTIADIEVSITDPSGDMWCSVYNRNRYGTTVGSETVYSSGTGDRVLDFGSVSGTAYEGYITVFCVLPMNGGRVNSIVVDLN